MERKSISKKLRFEVYKRDSFTCQYCGRKAPDVVLNIDHIKPVAKGGTNDILNLVTSCFDCNNGKRDNKQSLLLGLPMIQAITGEQSAPPFGVFVHESARTFCKSGEEPFKHKWWKWFLTPNIHGWDRQKTNNLASAITKYFENCEKLTISLDYPLEKIKAHKDSAEEYFLDV